MSNQLKTALIDHADKVKTRAIGHGRMPPDYVFMNRTGGLIDPNNWRRRVFGKVLEKSGLKKIRIHDLRHTYATLRIMKGHNIADVSNQLGHHSIKFTMDIYYHWMPGQSKSEVDELDD